MPPLQVAEMASETHPNSSGTLFPVSFFFFFPLKMVNVIPQKEYPSGPLSWHWILSFAAILVAVFFIGRDCSLPPLSGCAQRGAWRYAELTSSGEQPIVTPSKSASLAASGF